MRILFAYIILLLTSNTCFAIYNDIFDPNDPYCTSSEEWSHPIQGENGQPDTCYNAGSSIPKYPNTNPYSKCFGWCHTQIEAGTPECAQGFDPYPKLGGGFNCFEACTISGQERKIDVDGYATDVCQCVLPKVLSVGQNGSYCGLPQCQPWQELINGTCQNKCPENTIRQGASCVPIVDPDPECLSNEILIDGVCVEVHQNQCQTVVESIDCFRRSITNKLDDLGVDIDDQLSSISELLTEFLDNFDPNINNNPDNPPPDPTEPEPVDTSPLNAEIPVINTQLQEFNNSLFPTNASCPPDNSVQLLASSFSFSYQEICNGLSLLSNLVMLISILIAISIVSKT